METFFEKLKENLGVEKTQEPQDIGETTPPPKETPKKKTVTKRKVAVKKDMSQKEDKSREAEVPVSQDWFEPEGELMVDVYQTEDEVIIQTAIAGLKPSEVDVSIEQDTVTISGKRQSAVSKKEKETLVQELYWGAFSRQIMLSEEVDASRAQATMKDGLFVLRIPRLQREKVHKVSVKT